MIFFQSPLVIFYKRWSRTFPCVSLSSFLGVWASYLQCLSCSLFKRRVWLWYFTPPTHLCFCTEERETWTDIFKTRKGRRRFYKVEEQVAAQCDYHQRRWKQRERRGKKRKTGHKRPSWLVPLHRASIFPLTHGTLMKTDFKGEDEKHSLLKAKCFTKGPCTNTALLSEKRPTVELTNRLSLKRALRTAWDQMDEDIWGGLELLEGPLYHKDTIPTQNKQIC